MQLLQSPQEQFRDMLKKKDIFEKKVYICTAICGGAKKKKINKMILLMQQVKLKRT